MTTAGAAGQPVLELKGIGKDFGAIRALHDIDMQVSPGEVVGLMGDNGAGKSTLVKIIAGNFPATHGEIRFESSGYRRRSDPARSPPPPIHHSPAGKAQVPPASTPRSTPG